jgi:hypothetical protein
MAGLTTHHFSFETDDPETYDGAPVGIQLVGRRLEEEKMLSLAQVVADAVREYKEYESQITANVTIYRKEGLLSGERKTLENYG